MSPTTTSRRQRAVALGTVLAVLAPMLAHADDSVCDAQFLEAQKAEKSGKLVEAYDALSACAVATCGTNMSDTCNKRRLALAEKIPSVVVAATEGSKTLAGFTVTIDGMPIAAEGKAVAVNPGAHTFEFVTADGRSKTIDVVVLEGKKAQEVSASFEPAPETSSSTAATTVTSTSTVVSSDTPTRASSQKTYGLILAGGGLVVVGVGGVLGLIAKGKFNDSNDGNCDAATNKCNADGVAQRDSARHLSTTATIVTVVGALAAAGGVVLWLTAPSATEKTSGTGLTSFGIAPSGLVLGGRF